MRPDQVQHVGESGANGALSPTGNRRFCKRFLGLMLLVAIAMFSVGFVSLRMSSSYRLQLATGIYKAPVAMQSGWERHFALTSDAGVSISADLSLRALPFAKEHNIEGQVVLTTPKWTYPVRLAPQQYLSRIHMPDGRPLFLGGLSGFLTTGAGEDQKVAIIVAFVPDGQEQYMTLSVGTIGNNAEFVFGDTFFTPEVMAEIQRQINR